MIKRSFFLLSTATFFFWGVNVSIASDSFNTHTQHTPIELKPVSLNPQGSFQVASVCFLGVGCGDDGKFNKGDNYELDSVQQCKNEGFNITTCTAPEAPYGQCPYHDGYFKECKDLTAEKCKDAGYSNNCPEGNILDDTQVCPYNGSYKKCKCNPCGGYDYTYAQATSEGYVAGASCNSCGTMKYQRQNAACSGFLSCECGGEIGASSCKSGTNTLFKSCKSCCPDKCSLDICPENHVCRYEKCSGKYCKKSCITGAISKGYGNYRECIIGDVYCAVSWIYYKDGTCLPPSAHISDKEALGVVVSITDATGTHGQIMTAKHLGNYAWGTKGTAGENTDIKALPNYSESHQAREDLDSCGNTDEITKNGDKTVYPAAWAARDYVPENAPETKGKWCLPAYGVLESIYNNLSAIQTAIIVLNGTLYDNNANTSVLSSTENTQFMVWYSPSEYGDDGSSITVKGVKGGSNEVRAVMEF